MATPQETLELYQMVRSLVFRYQLDQVETVALDKAMRAIEKAIPDLLQRIQGIKKGGGWTKQRLAAVNKELWDLSKGIRAFTGESIGTLAGRTGREALRWHGETLSVNGMVPVNFVTISPAQFKSLFETNPLGKHKLTAWVDRAFDAGVIQSLERDLQSGMLQGKSYRGMVNDLMKHMEGFTRNEARTIAKTYVQTSNRIASESVMRANEDILKGWKWSAQLETSYMGSGHGVCLSCAVLDGEIFPVGGGPDIPLHHNCRCVQVFVTKTWDELGIHVGTKELEEAARPWVYREDLPIGEGGRKILEWGDHKGEYASWFENQGKQFKLNALGPKRYELWKSGDFGFKDFVDTNTGRLKLIRELTN